MTIVDFILDIKSTYLVVYVVSIILLKKNQICHERFCDKCNKNIPIYWDNLYYALHIYVSDFCTFQNKL